mmetsp:Transcript_4112/g.7911  ORF Transcript_4112/g.7911 Transcript_4112/m.7911 type:complete len:145 (-) Transcript_4112:896-1330(-)
MVEDSSPENSYHEDPSFTKKLIFASFYILEFYCTQVVLTEGDEQIRCVGHITISRKSTLSRGRDASPTVPFWGAAEHGTPLVCRRPPNTPRDLAISPAYEVREIVREEFDSFYLHLRHSSRMNHERMKNSVRGLRKLPLSLTCD